MSRVRRAARRRCLPARRVDWFQGSRVAAAVYLVGLVGLPGFVVVAVVLDRVGSGGGSTAALVFAALSTWPTGELAEDRSGWESGFRRSWVTARYQLWTTVGGPLPQALRCLRRRSGEPSAGQIRTGVGDLEGGMPGGDVR